MDRRQQNNRHRSLLPVILITAVLTALLVLAAVIVGGRITKRSQSDSQQIQQVQKEPDSDGYPQTAGHEPADTADSEAGTEPPDAEEQSTEPENPDAAEQNTGTETSDVKEQDTVNPDVAEQSTETGNTDAEDQGAASGESESETEIQVRVDRGQTLPGTLTADGHGGTEKTAAQTEDQTEAVSGTKNEAQTEPEAETESETEPERLTVAVDPGHQGSWVNMSEQEPNGPGSSEMKAKATTGTQGRYSGKKEYELNLEVSLLLRDELEARGYRVVLTREDHDAAISNAERAQMAWEAGSDVYVRIHANGEDSGSADGALAMVPSEANPYVGALAADSYLLGSSILDAYCARASFDNLGVQYYDNMSGINWSRIPVMILEMGFMTNQSDDLRMADPQTQRLMAEGIADGIDRYFEQKGMRTGTSGTLGDRGTGGRTEQSESEAEPEVSEIAAAAMARCFEQIGEDFVYPAIDTGEDWAVSLINLTTGASGDINGDTQMQSASVIKLFLMAAVYDRVCYPVSDERYIYFPESYEGELKQLLTDMITVSDNTAANTILERLGQGSAAAGMAVVNQFCEENGYTGTVFGRKFLEENPSGDNVTTANDCRKLLTSIARGTCVNAEASAKMLDYLKNQTRLHKIPQGIEGMNAVTANKTGELGGEYGSHVENDVAIVESGNTTYVLCILSQDLRDNGAGQELIRKISEAVYVLTCGV